METQLENEWTPQPSYNRRRTLRPKKLTSSNSPLGKWRRPGQTLEGLKTATSWPPSSWSDSITHLRPIRHQKKSANSRFSDERDKVRRELVVFLFPPYSCWVCEDMTSSVTTAIFTLWSASRRQKANMLSMDEQKRRNELELFNESEATCSWLWLSKQ